MNADTICAILVTGLWSLGSFLALYFMSKEKNSGFDHFISFFGVGMLAVISLFAATVVSFVSIFQLGFLKLYLALMAMLAVWYVLARFVTPIHNLAGDFFNKPRCYGCGESHLFRRDYSIESNEGSGTVLVCHNCGKNPERMKPVCVYARLLRTGIGSDAAYRIERSVVNFKEIAMQVRTPGQNEKFG